MDFNFRLLAVVAIVVVGGMATVSASYYSSAVSTEDGSTTIEIEHDQPFDLPAWELEDVTVSANSTELDEGVDYAVNYGDGHITFLSDGSTTEGEVATVEYRGEVAAELASTFAAPISSTTIFVGIGILVIAGSLTLLVVGNIRGGRA